MKLKVYGACCALLCLAACHDRPQGELTGESIRQTYDSIGPTPVSVMILAQRPFREELICNGIASAHVRSALSFRTSGIVDRVPVRNGDRVAAGDTLAVLMQEDALLACRSAVLNLHKAEMALESRLIEYGYRLADTALMDRHTLGRLCISTGWTEACITLDRARMTLDACILRAPFSGRVAQMACVPHEPAPGVCCTLLDDRIMDIGFSLLETETGFIRPGCSVTVSPFHDTGSTTSGQITAVDPLIGQNGQIAVTAEVKNSNGLLDGMHVRVVLSNTLDAQWVVPKEAVVLRDNLHVVFRYVNGRSAWTYVRIVRSNSAEHVIEPDTERNAVLTEGDTLIISGHTDLGDNVPVRAEL